MNEPVNQWRQGRATVGATAARIHTDPLVGYHGLMLTADADNSETIFLGPTSAVTADDTATGGITLSPGSTKSFPLSSPHLVYAIAEAPGQGLAWALF